MIATRMTLPGTGVPSAANPDPRPDAVDRAAEALRNEKPLRDPRLQKAAELIKSGRSGTATRLLSEFVRDNPRDAQAFHLWAEAISAVGQHDAAQSILATCLKIEPDFLLARYDRAVALLRARRPDEAIAECDQLLRRQPRNPVFRALKASALEPLGGYPAAAALWRQLAEDYPSRPENWERYGLALRAMGRLEDCIAAYRKRLAIEPSSGRGWWELADLKAFRFENSDIEQMELQLGRVQLSSQDRIHLHFALGRAYGQRKLFERSFANYSKGNALCHRATPYDPQILTAYVARCKEVFTAEFFRERSASGCHRGDAIFIVGMRRSGSTLVEQILASHSQVEATRELHELARILDDFMRKSPPRGGDYPIGLETIDSGDFEKLGEAYLQATRVHRKSGRPFFTDKMAANFAHVGLIQLILPKARIIDVRRHPLPCCFSNFIQLFVSNKKNAARLADIAQNYRDYVRLMAHFDAVLPGKIHRVIHEQLVERPEYEIRRLLDYLGLPFEQSCVEFHRTERTIATVSAEQVRRPISRDGMEEWRNYEPWLGPLREALGATIDAYPQVPADFGPASGSA